MLQDVSKENILPTIITRISLICQFGSVNSTIKDIEEATAQFQAQTVKQIDSQIERQIDSQINRYVYQTDRWTWLKNDKKKKHKKSNHFKGRFISLEFNF